MLKLEDIEIHKNKILNDEELMVYKPIGMTPKEIVDIVIQKTAAKKGCFVGRLDPLAHGIQHILLNEKCKLAKNLYERNKIYRFKIIFGIETDSLDLLGKPIISIDKPINVVKIIELLEDLKKNYIQKLPIYSSYRVSNSDGIINPLWWWTKNKRINEIQIPKFHKKIYDYTIGKLDCITFNDLRQTAISRINSINLHNDFNQNYIIEKWKNLEYIDKYLFQILEITISVSSGFYIRQLVEDIGEFLDIKTTTFEIERLNYF